MKTFQLAIAALILSSSVLSVAHAEPSCTLDGKPAQPALQWASVEGGGTLSLLQLNVKSASDSIDMTILESNGDGLQWTKMFFNPKNFESFNQTINLTSMTDLTSDDKLSGHTTSSKIQLDPTGKFVTEVEGKQETGSIVHFDYSAHKFQCKFY